MVMDVNTQGDHPLGILLVCKGRETVMLHVRRESFPFVIAAVRGL